MDQNPSVPANETDAVILMAIAELKFVTKQANRLFAELEASIQYRHDLLLSIAMVWPGEKKRIFIKDPTDSRVTYLVHLPENTVQAIKNFEMQNRIDAIKTFIINNMHPFEEQIAPQKPILKEAMEPQPEEF